MRVQVAQSGSKENVARAQAQQPQPAVKKPQPRGMVAELLNLQRTHGNRFVGQLLNGGGIQRKCACGGGCPRCKESLLLQTKLKINQPGDRYEQEADRVADRVMRMPEPSVQRQMEPEEDEEEEMGQRKIDDPITPLIQRQVLPEMEEEEEEVIQTKTIDNQPAPSAPTRESSEVPSIVHEVLISPGQPLDAGVRAFMESRFGYDILDNRSHVKTAKIVAERERKEIEARLDELSEVQEESAGFLETAWSIVGCDSIGECLGDVALTVATAGTGKALKFVVKGARAVKKARKARKVVRSAA
jgi:hypothetical protein